MANMVNWKPLDSVMRDFLGDFSPLFDMRPALMRDDLDYIPKLDIKNTEKEFEVSLDLPGLEKKDIAVSVEDGVLTIKGERGHEKREEKDGYTYVERRMGRFERGVRLPENVNEADIKADYKDGVLKLHAVKRQVAKPAAKNIQIT